MDFSLKVFKKVADNLSYTKAAKELYITQPAVTKQINKLEDHFGKALFNRQGSKVSLTSEGKLLLVYANKISELYKDLENDFLALDDKLPAKMRIAASTTITQYVLPKIFSSFKAMHPKVDITLFNGNSEEIEALVLAKKVDMGFTEGRPSNRDLHYETFMNDEIVLTTRVSNNKIKTQEIRKEQLLNLPLVVREKGSGTRNVIESVLKKEKILFKDLNFEMVLGSTEGIKSFLMHTDAYAFISIHAIMNELQSNKLKIIDVKKLEINRTFQFVHLHGDHSQTIKKMKQFCTFHYNLME